MSLPQGSSGCQRPLYADENKTFRERRLAEETDSPLSESEAEDESARVGRAGESNDAF